MLPWIGSFFIRSHFAVVAPGLTSLLYKRIQPSVQPTTLFSLYRYKTYLSSGSLCEINSAIPSKPIGILSEKSVPFRIGFSQLSYAATRSSSTMGDSSSKGNTSVYDFAVKDIKGNDVDLSQYKGKVLLIVNVASECGLTTSNYKEMSEIYAKYKDQGLEILAFPCNQFGGQEPGTNEQIAEVACTRFKADFPIFDKVDVNGDNAAPIYKFLKSSKGGLFGNSIKWNFTKFLVDKDGNVVERYAPTTSPLSIEKKIKKLLGVA